MTASLVTSISELVMSEINALVPVLIPILGVLVGISIGLRVLKMFIH